MAHYAFINPNTMKVVEVITGKDEDDIEFLPEGFSNWEEYYQTKREGLICKRTSYNTAQNMHFTPDGDVSDTQEKTFRGNYAGIGMTYDIENDVFLYPQTYASWVMDEATWTWVAPVPYPDDGQRYYWNEESTSWVLSDLQ